MKKINLYFLLIILSSSMWALDGVFLTPRYFTYGLYSTKIIVFLAHIIPTLLLLLVRPKLIINIYQTFEKKDYKYFWMISLLGGALGTIFIVKALQLVEFNQFSIVALIQQLQPMVAVILAIFILKERPKPSFFLVLIISIISIYLLKFQFKNPLLINRIEIMPIVYSLLAVISFGSSTVFSRKVAMKYDFILITFTRFLFTTLIMIVIIVFSKSELQTLHTVFNNTNILTNAFIIAIWGLLANMIYYKGMTNTTALHATIGELSFPVVSVILNVLIYNTHFSNIQIIAGSVLIISIFIYNLKRSNEK